jgi:di- and tripeptidase
MFAFTISTITCSSLQHPGDSTVRIWSTQSLSPLYVIHPAAESDAGDIFALAWWPALSTIFFGCQNTSLQWFNCSPLSSGAMSPRTGDAETASVSSDGGPNVTSVPGTPGTTGLSLRKGKGKVHKFFDSYPQYQRRPADAFATNGVPTPILLTEDGCMEPLPIPGELAAFDVPLANVADSAHYGYVYCMALLPSTRDPSGESFTEPTHLVTGSGDETVKVVMTGFMHSASALTPKTLGVEVALRSLRTYIHV